MASGRCGCLALTSEVASFDKWMRRILITGNAGSGKSTLANIVAGKLKLPLYSLDQVVWKPGWKAASLEERNAAFEQIIAQPQWVVDGVSKKIMASADAVVFLDIPRWQAYLRVTRRNLPYLFRSRPGLPEHCPEILVFPKLCKIIWDYPVLVRPGILEAMNHAAPQQFFHIRTRAQYQEFILQIC